MAKHFHWRGITPFSLILLAVASSYGSEMTLQTGELYIHGAMLVAPCRLSMRSEFQDVSMESSSLASLHNPGDSGQPVTFVIRILGCRQTGGLQTSNRSGETLWDKTQPVTSFSFLGPVDPDESSLLLLKGVSGAGLMIQDEKGRKVLPGEKGHPHFLTPGEDALVYTITPVRTRGTLTTGRFRATLNFGVSYD